MSRTICGYHGKQLRVLLNTGEFLIEDIEVDVLRKYIGGVSYACYIITNELNPGIDPFSSKNKIVFATSPLTSKRIPGGGSVMICFKSPLTGVWGQSRCGGEFGLSLRSAGYDALIIEGRSSKPVFLVINNDEIQLKPAEMLKLKTVTEKNKLIKNDIKDKNISILCIGPGGELLVRYATIMVEQRAAGRCGGGAVMGSKNLLAIAVQGNKTVQIADPSKLKIAIKNVLDTIKNDDTAHWYREHGTTGVMEPNDDVGDWPTQNWKANSWGKGEALYKYFYDNCLVKNKGCYKGCAISCGRIAGVKTGKFKTPEHEGSEYESISAFTAFMLNEDMDSAVHSTYLCNEFGLDTISAGASIAFVMECYENGLLNKKDVSGLTLKWGNPDVLPILVKMIAFRKGIGGLLAEGVRRAAEIIGQGSEKFAIHVKGLEGPAHDTRASKAMALSFGTANRGMCHIQPVEAVIYDLGKKDYGLMKYGLPDPQNFDRWMKREKGKS